MESRMKEPHKKGVATRLDPESCAGARKGMGEALTGAHAGQVLSSEMGYLVQRADHVCTCTMSWTSGSITGGINPERAA